MSRKIEVTILGDSSDVERAFKRSARSAEGFNRSMGQASRGALAASVSFKGLGRSVAFASGAFLGGAGLVSVLKSSVGAASNLAEQTSKTNVVFGRSAKAVEAWSKTTVSSMGLAQDQALETASSFGALLTPLGLTGAAAAKQSTRLTKLGADLASFYNTSVSDALDAIRSGLIGEAEPLRKYGVLLTEARVQTEALAETGKKSASQLTQTEKVLARQALIYRDTTKAQGDFVRTSGGLANQQRILSANVRQLEENIGGALIPDVLKITHGMNEWLGKSENQARVTRDVHKAVAGLNAIVSTGVPLVRSAANATERLSKMLGGAKNSLLALGLVMGGLKLRRLALGLTSVGTEAQVASRRVNTLNARYRALGSLNPVTLTIGLALTPEALKLGKRLSKWTGGLFGDSSEGWLIPGHSAADIAKRKAQAQANGQAMVTQGTAGTHLRIDPATGAVVPFQLGTSSTQTSAESAARRAQRMVRRSLRRTHLGLDGDLSVPLTTPVTTRPSVAHYGGSFHTGALPGEANRARAAAAAAASGTLAARFQNLHLGVEGDPLTLGAVNRAMAARQQAAQYRALGLMASGEEFAPTRAALLKQANKLTGTLLDSDPNTNRLAKIRKALTSNWQALNRETKLAIKGLLDAMDTGGDKGPQIRARAFNPASLTKGLGLTRAEAKAIQFRLAGMHLTQTPIGAAAAGGITIHVHSRSNDPKAVARETIAALQKEKGRRSEQVRGPHAGHPLGI